MRKKATKLGFILALFVTVLLFAGAPAFAADLSTCGNCHDWMAKPNSDVTKFVLPKLVDGSATGSTVDKSKCVACHTTYLSPSHQGVAVEVQSVNGVVYGSFASLDSLYQTPSFLHDRHNAYSLSKMTGDSCLKCHYVASCTSCHSSVPHLDHYSANPVNPKTGTSISTPVLEVSTGYVYDDNGTIYPTWDLPMSCATSECHQTLPSPKRLNTDGSDLCYNCHNWGKSGHEGPQLEAGHSSLFSNQLKFASVSGYVYYDVSCTGCHNSALSTEHTNRGKDCAVCHKSTNIDILLVVQNASGIEANRACEKCHFNGILPKPEHTLYHIATQSNNLRLDGAPHNDCNTCHQRQELLPTIATLANSTTKDYSCLTCHTGAPNPKAPLHKADYNGEMMGIMDVHTRCDSCHTSGTTYAAAVDTVIGKLKAGATGYSCTECHPSLSSGHQASFDGVSYPDTTAFHAKCTDCHNENYKTTVASLKDQVKLGIGYDCSACHTVTATKGTSPYYPEHKAGNDGVVGFHTKNSCFSCHGTTKQADGTKAYNIDLSGFRLKLPTPGYACADCHNGTVTLSGLVANKPFHQAKDDSGTVYTDTTAFHPSCGACHSSTNTDVTTTISLNRGTTTPYNCSDCHKGGLAAKHNANFTYVTGINGVVSTAVYGYETTRFHKDCAQCHSSSNPEVYPKLKSIVDAVNADPNTTYQCVDCHGGVAGVPAPVHQAPLSVGGQAYEATVFHAKTGTEAKDQCFTCHNNPTVASDLGAIMTNVKNGQGYLCTDCHKNPASAPYQPNHSAVLGSEQFNTLNEHPACITCHTTDADTNIRTLKGQTGYSCEACHTNLTEKHQSTTDLTSTMNMINCSWCHSSTEPAYATNNLIGVHVKPNIPLTKDYTCNVCHSSTSPVRTQIANKKTACDACHDGIAAPASHPDSQYYPRHVVNPFPAFMPEYSPNCSTCHTNNSVITLHTAANVGCKSCHYTDAYKPAVVSLNADCSGCHTATVSPAMDMAESHKPFHNANTTLYPDTAECLNCHAKDTTVDGQSLLGVHKKDSASTVTCDTCHGSTARQAVKDAIAANNVSCQACHGTVEHKHAVTSYEAAPEVNCVNCHSTGTATDPATNVTVKTTELSALHDKYGKTCAACHTSPFLDNVIAGDGSIDMLKNGSTAIYCGTCHNGDTANGYPVTGDAKHAPEHKAVMNENVDCTTCHDGTTVKSTVTAAAAYGTETFTDTHAAGCNTCHNNAKVEGVISAKVGIANSTYNCAECHDGTKAKTHNKLHTVKSYLTGSADTSCASCHSNGDVVAVHSGTSGDGTVLNCGTCHTGNPTLVNTTTVIKANLSSNPDRTGFTCQDCHSDITGGHDHNVAAGGYDDTPKVDCAKCHSTKTDGTAELAAIHKDAADRGKITNYSCTTCHNSTFVGTVIKSDGALDMKQNGTTVIYCDTCHNGALTDALGTKYPAHAGNHINSTGYGTYKGTYNGVAFDDSAADCSKCHTSLDTKVVHDPAVHTNVNCNSCHLSANTAVQSVISGAWSRAATKASYTCSDCHNTLPYLHKPEHVGTSANAASLNCAGCHSEASWSGSNAQVAGVHKNNCNTCHASSNSVVSTFITGKQGLDNPAYNCEGCHTTGGAKAKEEAHQPEHLAQHSATNMDCSSCHGFSAAAGVATDIKSTTIHKDGCNTCHGAATRSDVKLFIASKLGQSNPVYNCEDCHGTIHVGWEDKHKPVFPSDPSMDCDNCHTNYLPTEHTRYFGTGDTNVGYKVFRSDDGGKTYAHVGSTTGTGYSSGSLKSSTTYYFKVQAYDLAGNHSDYSTVVSATTPAPPPATTTLNPGDAQYSEGIDGDTKADGNFKSLNPSALTRLTDGKDSNGGSYDVTVREDGSSDKWIYAKVSSYDAKNYASIKLMVRASWKDSISTGDFWIYPYLSDGKGIDTNARVTYNISKPTYNGNFTNYTIDVTNAAHKMDGYGWIKFRIKPGSYSKGKDVRISEVRIILENPSTTESSTTTPDSTLSTVSSNDTTPPTVPGSPSAKAYNSAQIDLAWTASTDEGPTVGESNTCVLCHGSSAPQRAKDAVAAKNANCSACHDLHGDIATIHTGNALPTTPWQCSGCHTNVLSVEHSANATLEQNAALNCDTCHKSSLTKVKSAIDSTVTDKSNLNCDACHTGTSDGVEKVHSDLRTPHLTAIFPTASDGDCLKCHTTQAGEFVSTKGAYHVVDGLTSKASGYGTYLSPWTYTSIVTCQGCHGDNNDGKAQAANILKRPYSYTSNSGQADMLCFLCHDRNAYGAGTETTKSGFSRNGKNLHNIGDHEVNNVSQCSWCHTSKPHSTNKAHLIVTKSDPNSAGNTLTNYTHPASGTYQKSSCGSDVNACDDHKGY